MPQHDPLAFASSFSAKLASRARHVCLFLGAGIARACNLPDVALLEKRILAQLDPQEASVFQTQLYGRNLEEALSRLRRIASLLSGEQMIDGLTAHAAQELDEHVCECIVQELDISVADLNPVRNLATWALRANSDYPIEIFTVNYDLLLEVALESLRVPYFDGFIGNLQASFHTELVENIPGEDVSKMPGFFVRLWKLHGSVNWEWIGSSTIVRTGGPVHKGKAAAIYPSDTKYQESRRMPFIALMDRFRRSLLQPESFIIISGYSFGDDHLNEMVFDAAARRERSEFTAFSYGAIPDILAEMAVRLPNLQVVTADEAILGGIRAKWRTPTDVPDELWHDGKFGLRDFAKLSLYLSRSVTSESERERTIRNLVEVISPVAKEKGRENG